MMLVSRCTKLMPSSSIRQAKPMENFTKSRMIQRLSLNKLGKRHKKISTRRLRISTRRLRGKRSKRRTGFLVGLALGASNAELSSAVPFWIIDSSFKIWHQDPADCISICTHTLAHLLTSMLCLSWWPGAVSREEILKNSKQQPSLSDHHWVAFDHGKPSHIWLIPYAPLPNSSYHTNFAIEPESGIILFRINRESICPFGYIYRNQSFPIDLLHQLVSHNFVFM